MLYITGTPIGNLEDMSYRAVKTLNEVDEILCEDTRTTKKLTNHFDITTPLRSYHDFNKEEVTEDIVEKIRAGKHFALVTDAGMPVISDPGFELVSRLQDENLPYIVIPAASAFTMGLVASGIASYEFTYFGFLPKSSSKRQEKLSEIMHHNMTSVLYESPHRMKALLEDISKIDDERIVSISREITKKFEQHYRTTATDLLSKLDKEIPLKGEFVVVISAYEEEAVQFTGSAKEHVSSLIADGMKPKDAIKLVAELRGLKKQEVYDEFHK
ncbi:16S rRNA (cytidine(1402)-2'-O)-methyltransferase [Jeotgalicoccus meleagridis]|uniref:Ribosomal RNA small subunit methyltransferase I n=1 Tax=Jeotgalicoccus meleagridis TaxID=2759181 RepID=A0A6V7RCM2_9STAP|nr:16S rRNA (cytidine(1402)-2'-O)-methyltransferase [Jeotgalicoccus meleagridis]CAD2074672.1 Ribosomal RNA small subunit methyltransferase I [Jeotgalicoccus meleagridis]